MRKSEIIKEISRQTGIETVIIGTILESFMSSVEGHILKKEYVVLNGFGRFGIKKRAAKFGRNISKNEPIELPAQFIPYFKPSKKFKDSVKKVMDRK